MALSRTLPEPGAAHRNPSLDAIWRHADKSFHPDASLPDIVIANRRERALARIQAALASRGSDDISLALQADIEGLLRHWAERAYEDSFSPVQEFEIRCARDRDLVIAEASGDEKRILDVLERDYRKWVVDRFGQIELRGVQVSHRVRLDLNEVYIPLHLEAIPLGGSKDGKEVIELQSMVRRPVDEVLHEHRRIVIVGSPGSGKSTLVQALATGHSQSDSGLLPLIVVPRQLGSGAFPPDLDADARVVARSFAEKRAVVYIDGLDEVPTKLRNALTKWIARFSSEHPDTTIILTSRPMGAPGEMEQCLAGFQPFRLSELTQDEVGQFIDKWCLSAERNAQGDTPKATADAAVAAEDLISRIARTRAVQRIAVNPLLATILCIVHRFLGRTIPEHRVTLYERCTDALLYEWDRAKFPGGSAIGMLDAQQKRTLLRGIARRLHESNEAEIHRDDVIEQFRKVLPSLGRPEGDAEPIVQEIRDRSGLLVEKREGFFGFSHLTFQEYLAALDFVATRKVAALLRHWKSPWWQEVIALAAGMPGSDADRLISDLLAKKNPSAVFLAASCLETSVDVVARIRQEVENAIAKLVPPQDLVGAARLTQVGSVAVPSLISALLRANSYERALILWTLGRIDYEPAVHAITKFVGDRGPTNFYIDPNVNLTVGDMATDLLIRRVSKSPAAFRAVQRGLEEERSLEVLLLFQKSIEGIPNAAERMQQSLPNLIQQAIARAERHPTSAKRTASKRSNKPSPAKTNGRGASQSTSARSKRSPHKPLANR